MPWSAALPLNSATAPFSMLLLHQTWVCFQSHAACEMGKDLFDMSYPRCCKQVSADQNDCKMLASRGIQGVGSVGVIAWPLTEM